MNHPPPPYYVQPRPEQVYEDEGPLFSPWLLRLFLLGLAGVFLLVFSLMSLAAGYHLMTQDQIYVGVSPVYGVQLAGLTPQEAERALSQVPTYADQAQFTFTFEDQSWTYSAAELGLEFDIPATVDRAYQAGRAGNWTDQALERWRIWRDGYAVAPVIRYNRSVAENLLTSLAQNAINQPVQDATLTFQDGLVSTTPSRTGRQVDVQATLAQLDSRLVDMPLTAVLPLVVETATPRVAEAESAAQQLQAALDPRGVTFYIPAEIGADAGPWIAQVGSIQGMLSVRLVEQDDSTARYEVDLSLDEARAFLNELSAELNREAQDARFIFNEGTGQLEVIQPSVNGRRLDVEATLAGFPEAVFSADNRSVALVFEQVIPTVNSNATAESLGIRELIAQATTYFGGSSAARRANIQVASAKFHGVVIAPGEEFSFNRYLGDVGGDEGFEEALIIVGNQTITGVGGGVCQVSTTAFQAAFMAGFPILERYAHGYRVAYYEQAGGIVGMDAAIFTPTLDFRFLNDTPYHLLIETYMRPATSEITFRFYSTSMGRRVEIEGPIIKNEKAPPTPVYRADESLAAGQIVQTDYAVAGMEVFVYRTIYQNEQVLVNREEFYSNYIPWPDQYLVPPGDPRLTTSN